MWANAHVMAALPNIGGALCYIIFRGEFIKPLSLSS